MEWHMDGLDRMTGDPLGGDPGLDIGYEPPGTEAAPAMDDGLALGELPNFAPGLAVPLAGDPGAGAAFWEEQQQPDTCAVASQASILHQLTGVDHDEADLAREAEANGWYQPGAGTPLAHMDRLLEAHGVPTETRFGGSVEGIAEALEAGDKVIVSVDSGELWTQGEDPYLNEAGDAIPGQGADHAVEVTGVVQTSEGPMVVLNDPGNPDGRGCMIAVDEFDEAWADSDRFMVIAGPNADSSVDAFGTHGLGPELTA